MNFNSSKFVEWVGVPMLKFGNFACSMEYDNGQELYHCHIDWYQARVLNRISPLASLRNSNRHRPGGTMPIHSVHGWQNTCSYYLHCYNDQPSLHSLHPVGQLITFQYEITEKNNIIFLFTISIFIIYQINSVLYTNLNI